MNTKLAIVATFLAVVIFGSMTQALAQSRVPGVKTGDEFIYTVYSTWKSDNASAIMPSGLSEYNNTSQFKVQVSVVQGVNATATYTWDFVNGTQMPFLLTQDVESGQSFYHSYIAPPLEIFVGANLNAGDVLHPTGNDTFTINQTISRAYAGGSRDTNVIEVVIPIQQNETDTTVVGSTTDRFYIDKATGVIVEQDAIIQHDENPEEKITVTWTLKETNVWDATPPIELSPTILVPIVAVVVVVVILIAVYYLRKQGKRKKSRRSEFISSLSSNRTV